MNKTKQMSYEAPVVEIIEVDVEEGFASSGNSINGWGDGGSYDETLDI